MRLVLLCAVACWLGAGCGPCASATTPHRIDVHVELHPYAYDHMLRQMEEAGIARAVNLAGGPPGEILAMLVELGELSQLRLLTVTNVDWRDVDDPDFGGRAARNLERAVALGARGLMITKALGLGVATRDGRLLAVNDPRLDPLWAKAAELDVPVWLHTADPAPYFAAIDEANPRREELERQPSLGYFDERYPRREDLLMERDLVIARHPRTTFICTGLASSPGDLASVDALLDLFPNVYVDSAAPLVDLQRQPYETVRAFFIKHHNRVLFGSGLKMGERQTQLGSPLEVAREGGAVARYLDIHRRYFESAEQPLPNPTPVLGAEQLQGLALPAGVLRAIYHENAERLLKLSRHATRPR